MFMNVSDDLIYMLPQELVAKFSGLITILKALGWVVIIYIVFNIINAFLNKKKRNELRKINENLEDIKKLLAKKK